MEKESLEIVLNECIDKITNAKIKPEDKIELFVNLRLFLCPELYKDNIRVLQEHTDRHKLKNMISSKGDRNANTK